MQLVVDMNRIKNNIFVRGLYFFFRSYFSHNKDGFGYIGNNVVISPPYGCVERKIFSCKRIQIWLQILIFLLIMLNL